MFRAAPTKLHSLNVCRANGTAVTCQRSLPWLQLFASQPPIEATSFKAKVPTRSTNLLDSLAQEIRNAIVTKLRRNSESNTLGQRMAIATSWHPIHHWLLRAEAILKSGGAQQAIRGRKGRFQRHCCETHHWKTSNSQQSCTHARSCVMDR